jgi:hypothetical protein
MKTSKKIITIEVETSLTNKDIKKLFKSLVKNTITIKIIQIQVNKIK